MKTSEIILVCFRYRYFPPPMSYKRVSEAFLRALLYLGSFFMPIILPCNIFFFFLFLSDYVRQ